MVGWGKHLSRPPIADTLNLLNHPQQYVNSCALSINYNDSDWSPKCKATLKDVKDHASAIFEKCSDGGLGTVGGQVKFTVDNCPAQIEIIKAAGQPPQGT